MAASSHERAGALAPQKAPVGLALDLAGQNPVLGWGLGFGRLALVSITGLIFVRRLG